ncbi:hypothetical protein CFP56_023309 [Quercus suber]|uniref:Uncharacterized protein n=1 Tax=Quercus suber TaxID=58331 RepID=A0AAW0KA97_QUESU
MARKQAGSAMDCDDSVQPPVDQADGDRNNLRKPNSLNPASTVSQQNTLHEEQQDAIKENHETPITPSVSDSIKNQNNEYVVEINVELAALMSENSKQPNPIVTEPRAPYTPSNSNWVNETHASHFKESCDRINDTIANHLNEPRDAHEAVKVSLKHEHLRVLPSWTRRARQGMKPNSIPSSPKENSYQAELFQNWHKNGQCPEGTVPIRRTQENEWIYTT